MTVKKFIAVKSALWLLMVLCWGQSLHAQSYTADIQRISVEDGLSSRAVNRIHKDSRGFIWIATNHGLNRYDGYTFKICTAENSALISNIIREIHEDSEQRLWLIQKSDPRTEDYIGIIDLETGNSQTFDQFFKDIVPFRSMDIAHVYSNAGNDLWIALRKGEIYRYRNNSFELVFTISEQMSLYSIFYADDRFLWLYSQSLPDENEKEASKELLKIDIQDSVIEKLFFPYNALGMVTGRDNRPWIFRASQKKLFQAAGAAEGPQSIDLSSLDIPEAVFDPDISVQRKFYINPDDDLIWWHQKKGDAKHFFIMHPRKGIVLDLQPEMERLQTYNHQIGSIYFDAENRAWVITDDGIFIITLKKNKFTTLLSGEAESYSVRGMTEDHQGTLHISTYNGRIRLQPETGEIIKKTKDVRVSLGVSRDSQGNIWFSGDEIEKYDPLSGQSQFYAYPANAIHLRPWAEWTIIRDKTGQVWMGSEEGLYVLEPQTGRYRKFMQYNAFSRLNNSIVYHLFEDEKGIWIASSTGLYLLEPGKDITARYAVTEDAPYHLPYDHLLHVHRDKAGIFWLGAKGGGLIRFNPEDGSYRRFTTADGLSNDIIYAVYEDDYGKLWLPSNYGLMQFDKNSYRIKTYLTGDGIAHDEFNTASHYRGTEGKLYFGGLDGITVFHPKDFSVENISRAPLRITGCRVLNGKTGALTDKTIPVSASGRLSLSPSDKSFIIDFALLNYHNSRQNSYTYTIEGLDKDWATLPANSLRINALPYGNYTLRIKGQGIRGESAANELAIAVTVLKPFYLKNGFIISCILALGLLIYGIFRWRLRNLEQAKLKLQATVRQRTREIQAQKDQIEQDKNIIERQAGKLQELDRAKSRFFANISHELRTPLTLILGHQQAMLRERYGKIGQQVRSNLEVSQNNSRRLLNMIEEILDLSKMEAGKLELHHKPVKLHPLIDRLCDTFRSYIRGKHIHFSWHIDLAPDLTVLLDEKKFEKIVANLLSNAAKFTPAGGSISVNAAKIPAANNSQPKENQIQLTVRDTGKGIHPQDLPHIFDRFYQGGDKDTPLEGGTGIGLALSKELAELFGGSLQADSQPGKGSVFTFVFPKKEVAALPEEVVIAETKHLMVPDSTPAKRNKIPTPAHKRQTPVILIVEDHPEMRSFIRQQIADEYRVLEAGDGLEALKILKRQKADLVLSDVMMPRMDGFQLLSTLRSDPATADISVIMLTARAAREDRMHALTIGVDDYLTKPFDEQELMARIRHSLRNRLKRKQWTARLPEAEKETITADGQFLSNAEAVVIKAVSNHSYSVIDMAEALNLSQRQLFRKIKAATGLSPLQFIREIRLQKARNLLESKTTETVAEVMYAVGFQKSGYFARAYHKRFGKFPSSYFS